jgi:drug/metabolite transporter (DMT)-like permease
MLMDFFYLFSSIMAESVGKTIDKLNYRRNRIGPRQMMFLVFLVMSISITSYILITKQTLPHISLKVTIFLLGVGAFSFGGNVFDELSLKSNDLSLREPLVDFEPILAGLIGYIIFPAQRKTSFLIAFILGAFIVRWGIHRRKLGKGQKKGMFYLLIGVILYAILPSLYQQTLHYISPSYLAFFRVTTILVLTSIFFPPKKWKGFTPKRVNYVIAAGIVYAAGAIVSLYAIQAYGVVLTMLFTMLGPALRYLAGQFILHEKVRRGEVLSSLMLTLVVALAAFAR